jgi:hypothetical protein
LVLESVGRGEVEKWWISAVGFRAERKVVDAGGVY